MDALPILYSFRRCPYAMRARMALTVSRQECELREILLRDKPAEFLEVSPSATVPTLIAKDGTVLDESLDIMLWALERNDPEGWLKPQTGDKAEMLSLIERMDGPFKTHLDNYKYATRRTAEDVDIFARTNRNAAMNILMELDAQLHKSTYLFGGRRSLADIAIAPFVRQFANTDAEWFGEQSAPALQQWLHDFVTGELFLSVMEKYCPWQSGTPGLSFPDFNRAA